ncbi:phosphate acyltransferase [Jannaschia rubra]|uniref:Ethanolamine utilization protein EutD n=1 Tax=Jannaschia rubra TaxID=282197 RepID=A0A0M6XSR8_9RHOB|nr:phosphate acyltransferase [Jannaschia rubra]CTQ34169.1 Ethanolamine utilization protein EutD [Jannaschia rubra]SFG21561.1 phosphotransacetylase [Jannaschia rubra]
MTSPLATLRDRARATPRHIVLAEGTDPRVREAARRAVAEGLARVTILAPEGTEAPEGVTLRDPATADTEALIDVWMTARARRHPTRDDAVVAVRDPLTHAALMVRAGLACGTIAGAVATTSETVRTALQVIGTAPGAPLVSSFFLMVLPDSHPKRPGAPMIFADCGLVIDPDPEQLAAIARQSAASARALLGVEPKVAMLSFSTKGSAHHMAVNKVVQALDLLSDAPFDVDGELQFDAAFDAGVGASKAPGSPVAGQANVLIFPDLDAGNIGYKIAQRIGGATAIGPVLQGLAKPANDLSRGCTADDIIDMIAVTSAQVEARE